MEASVALTLDCEDMFKEITKKLYGEEAGNVGGGGGGGGGDGSGTGVEFPACDRDDDELRGEEQLTAWGLAALMQGGFPPPGILSPNFTPRTDPTAEDRWSHADEPLAWAHSRVAAYNPAQRLFKCAECECVGFLARVAEHWLGAHSQARAFACPLAGCAFAAPWARLVRRHLARDHRKHPAAADALLQDNPALTDLTRYLQRLKARVDAQRRQPQPAPAAVAAPASVPAAAPAPAPLDPKRYVCGACPYATDRRDLFTRHEHIHRDDKPFHCYLCRKLFNRADHVKKHFLRMHRDHPYDLNRIRRAPDKPSPQQQQPQQQQQHQQLPPLPALQQAPPPPPPALVAISSAPTLYYSSKSVVDTSPVLEYAPPPVKIERKPEVVRAVTVTNASTASTAAGAAGAGAAAGTMHTNATNAQAQTQARRKGERRYSCVYCSWSGADNWCLKRHLNTHLKPFACALCEYKAARAERLATHVNKVHNKRACAKCPYLADDASQLNQHLRTAHHIEGRSLKVPVSGRAPAAVSQPPPDPPAEAVGHASGAAAAAGALAVAGGTVRRRAGAARLFGYLEASDGSGDEFDAPLEFATTNTPLFVRDKENAAPLPDNNPHQSHAHAHPHPHQNTHTHTHTHSHVMHDHCLRY